MDDGREFRRLLHSAVNIPSGVTVTFKNHPSGAPVVWLVQTTNFPLEGTVQVRVAQKYGGATWLTCAFDSGTVASATWTVDTTLAEGFSGIQARATVPKRFYCLAPGDFQLS